MAVIPVRAEIPGCNWYKSREQVIQFTNGDGLSQAMEMEPQCLQGALRKYLVCSRHGVEARRKPIIVAL